MENSGSNIIKSFTFIFCAINLFFGTCHGQDQQPFGYWLKKDSDSGKAEAVIKIYEEDHKLFGVIDSVFSPEGEILLCKSCPDDLKDAPFQGLMIINGLTSDGKEWSDGDILRPSNGKYYPVKIWIEQGNLAVRGYLGFLYKTQYWEPYQKDE
jgi:uncharacterized protein (DUF2147 family)